MIELLPIFEFPGTRSWGYNPAAPFAVESSYGSPDDFRALVDAAHARGIGVILDVVHNHYDTTLLRCWDGDCLGKQGIYFYTNQFANTDWGPRPDFSRPEVRAFIVENTLMWLNEYRCDGMRWDSTINIHGGNADGWNLLRTMNDAAHALDAAHHPDRRGLAGRRHHLQADSGGRRRLRLAMGRLRARHQRHHPRRQRRRTLDGYRRRAPSRASTTPTPPSASSSPRATTRSPTAGSASRR